MIIKTKLLHSSSIIHCSRLYWTVFKLCTLHSLSQSIHNKEHTMISSLSPLLILTLLLSPLLSTPEPTFGINVAVAGTSILALTAAEVRTTSVNSKFLIKHDTIGKVLYMEINSPFPNFLRYCLQI